MVDLLNRLIAFWRQRVSTSLLTLIPAVGIVGLLLAAIALWLFAKLANEVMEQETQAFDTRVLLAIHQFHNPFFDQLAIGISFIGQPQVLFVVCLILVVGLWFKRRAEAVALAIAGLGAVGLNFVLKDAFARARPELWQRIVDVRYYSFPSGHAMVSMVIYTFIGYLLIAHLRQGRFLVAALAVVLIGAIGLSRLYLGVHWPTDVLGGYAAGFVWVMTCVVGLQVWHRWRVEFRA
jgi:undecaprenyl-diphosphatase